MPHVRVGVGNYLLQQVDMLDFDGTETKGNRILHFLRHFIQYMPYVGFHSRNPLLNCTHTHKRMSVTESRLNGSVTKVMQHTLHAAILLPVRESCSCH